MFDNYSLNFSLIVKVESLMKELARTESDINSLISQKSLLQTDLNICRQELSSWVERCKESDLKWQQTTDASFEELLTSHKHQLGLLTLEINKNSKILGSQVSNHDVNR